MPWTPGDASRHTHKLKGKRQKRGWSKIANNALAEYGDEGTAIRVANAKAKQVRQKVHKANENYWRINRGRGTMTATRMPSSYGDRPMGRPGDVVSGHHVIDRTGRKQLEGGTELAATGATGHYLTAVAARSRRARKLGHGISGAGVLGGIALIGRSQSHRGTVVNNARTRETTLVGRKRFQLEGVPLTNQAKTSSRRMRKSMDWSARGVLSSEQQAVLSPVPRFGNGNGNSRGRRIHGEDVAKAMVPTGTTAPLKKAPTMARVTGAVVPPAAQPNSSLMAKKPPIAKGVQCMAEGCTNKSLRGSSYCHRHQVEKALRAFDPEQRRNQRLATYAGGAGAGAAALGALGLRNQYLVARDTVRPKREVSRMVDGKEVFHVERLKEPLARMHGTRVIPLSRRGGLQLLGAGALAGLGRKAYLHEREQQERWR